LLLTAGPAFLGFLAGHLFVRVKLRPKTGSDLDEYYYEFEHRHPGLVRYQKWSRITFAGAAVAALLLFLTMVI
jgi:hypothetical protein